MRLSNEELTNQLEESKARVAELTNQLEESKTRVKELTNQVKVLADSFELERQKFERFRHRKRTLAVRQGGA